ncbi:MAG TPA: ABC transporter permease [Pseudonocardiaceae bacterium]|nr:ABC transporter permease [Pseudonocardiaceae bacterium]
MPGNREPVPRLLAAPLAKLDELGDQLALYGRAIGGIPRALRCYRSEVARLLAEVSFGSGALMVVAGTAGVMAGLSLFVGAVVGLQGFRALDSLGTEALTGLLTGYLTTREIAPLVAAQAVICTLGAGYTAELGAMRISEEIDALEVMSVPSVAFLISTRVIAGFVAIIPLYTIGLVSSFAAARSSVTLVSGLPGGTYDHYFELFLPVSDVLWSYAKVLAFTFVIILICCHYGYRATGGPAGVGIAVGRAVRAGIVTVAMADFFLTLAIYGTASTVRVAG